jgi:NAD(P)-dependent dehydrogenase (short-subunit alcohol dehydrogenase family)
MKRRNNILITGASRGVGEKIAITFAEAGYTVCAVARNMTEAPLSRSALADTKQIRCYNADVTQECDVIRLMGMIAEEFESIEVLVNNAGSAIIKPFFEITLAEWNQVIDSNLTAAFLCTKHAFPLMKKNPDRKKHIFMMLSIASESGFPGWSAYCSAKFGALGFTEALRQELMEHTIKITGIISGAIRTTLWDNLPGDWDKSKMLDPQIIANTILEIYHKPGDVSVEKVVLMPPGGVL